MKISVFFENVLPAAVRGASREAGASLDQKSYYFLREIKVFFEHVLPAAVRSGSREAPQETSSREGPLESLFDSKRFLKFENYVA